MKLILVMCILSTFIISIQCRPQAVQPAEHRTAADVLKLPFYGGARGQILEIRKNHDGTVVSKILRGEEDEDMELKVHQLVDDLKNNEEILAEDDDIKAADQSFGDYLMNIQKAAASLVSLQEQVKKSGKLSSDQKRVYADNLERLGVAAQKLAHIQQQDGDHDAIKFLFNSDYDQSASDAQKKKTTYKITSFPGYKGKEEEDKLKHQQKKKEEEENVGEEDAAQGSDSVQVNSPEQEASIAEAKPVGLAIAGDGGVASSKPIATAVVGDGGLAVARPVATAIAGIKPSEIGSLGLPISVNKKLVTKGKYGLVAADQDLPAGLLVGPGFTEARVSQHEIEAEIDDARQQAMGQTGLVPNFDTEKFLANLRLKAKQQQQQAELIQQQHQQQQQQFNSPTIAFQSQPSFIPQSYPFATAASDYLNTPQYPVYTPSYSPYYYYNPYAAYQNPLALLAYQYQQQLAFQPQYNPYMVSANPLQHSFQQFDYPQRSYYSAALSAPTTGATAAAGYPSYYNYPSFSTPSPYRFFYY
ncbi:uncharacterized protein LOC134218444 isoform X1 [Armigeres subalbatus]|uniref:uncharacterized protein LOC134218444 isoform X1 n=1 Tax=Armigeres subalbatus TaxID=124917 RepID=UPI002ED3B977